MLDSIFQSVTQNGLTLWNFLLCIAASLAFGLAVAWLYSRRGMSTKSFTVTLALLPAVVQVVIMLVNGNLGAGIAVMGAFGLVRFRSVPGSAREISGIFFAMAIGLATGMGYAAFALLFLLIVGAATLLLNASRFGEPRAEEKLLRVTIPESLDYEGIFDDLFAQYAAGAQLLQIKTTNMGSLYELQYQIRFKGASIPREFLDQLRCRNGNLSIVCGRLPINREEF